MAGRGKVIKSSILVVALIIIVIGMMLTYQFFSILKWGEDATPIKSDTMIILGAGVWEHGPSPALSGRINLAAELYHAGLAEHIILSGGLGVHPPSEAEAMYTELSRLGVPTEAMYLEDQASNTTENMAFSAEIMREHGWETAIIVTDVFHYKRAYYVANKYGLDVSGATVKDSVLYRNQALKLRYTFREVIAWYWYRIKE